MQTSTTAPCLLTIAGFDPSSGAGVTADLAVFAAHRCFGVSAITALTVQSTLGVRRVEPVAAVLLEDTLRCLQDDLPADGIKIGMLADRAQVLTVARFLQLLEAEGRRPAVVLDPVVRSSSGATLLTDAGLHCMLRELLPHVDVITPNVGELSLMSGRACGSVQQTQEAAASLADSYEGLAIVTTGGELQQPDDLLLENGRFVTLQGTRVQTTATHGTGCAFSSALLCGMAKGAELQPAATAAKRYVEGALHHAEVRGAGKGPMRLLWPLLLQDG